MTFLAPWLLFGTSLAALPVLIHLFNRSRYRRIPWAAMEFLVQAKAKSSRRLKLEEILLLALRTLALLLVALAVSRPFLSGAASGGAPQAIILLDRSASMQYREAAGSLYDFGRSRVREIVAGLGQDAEVLFVTFDSKARSPMGGAPASGAGAVDEALEASKPGWAGTDYAAALEAAAGASNAFLSQAPAVFVVSDFRAGAGVTAPPRVRPRGPVYLVSVAQTDGGNAGISRVARPDWSGFTAAAGMLAVTISNSSGNDASIPVTLSIDGASAGTTIVTAPAGSAASANVAAEALRVPGRRRLEVSIPADAYPCDDRAWAVIEHRPLRVSLFASGDARKYIRAAFSAAPPGSMEVFDESNAPGALASGEGFVIASEPPGDDLHAELWAAVSRGGFVVCFLDPGHAPAQMRFLRASGEEYFNSLPETPALVEGPLHPALAGAHVVTDFLGASADISIASVTLARALDLPVPAGAAQTPIVFGTPSGPRPFLSIVPAGKGKIIIFNAAADRTSGDFVVSPFFVPLLFEALSYARGGQGSQGLFCGDEVMLPAALGAKALTVTGPAGRFQVELNASGEPAAVFAPEEPGFYCAGEDVTAVNVPPSESDMRLAGRGAVEKALGGEFVDASELQAGVAVIAKGRDLSGPLLLAAFLALGFEMAVVWYLKRF